MKDGTLPKIILVQPSRAKWKAGLLRLRRQDVIKKGLREMGISWESQRREALTVCNGGRSVRSCAGFRRLVDAVNCL